jgi:ribosomal protection tetracycline resistance protein
MHGTRRVARTLNLGILAHVDAGKTTLTERLLFAAGVIGRPGSVDDGDTQTDSLALERRRGITIKSAVVSFGLGGLTVNLIDTPGHPDFIAEVERVLSVLDGAVLVISAVEGVQAQTRVLMRTLKRLRIPTLIFVNKTDRAGARERATLDGIATRLTSAIAAMGTVPGLGTHAAGFRPFGPGDPGFTGRLAELLAEHDDALLAAYAEDETALPYGRLREALAAQTRRALVHPVFFGSAVTGAGTEALTAGIRDLLPAAPGAADGPLSGTVFKVERGPAGEKVAYVRMFSGTVRVRDRVPVGTTGARREERVTAIGVFHRGPAAPRGSVSAGEIGKLRGLGTVRVGDALGVPRDGPARLAGPAGPASHQFAPPTLETVVVPDRPADKGALHAALAELAEQDPLINLRQDDVRQELLVSLYGEVQKEVIQATLAEEFGVRAGFRETTTICIERPAGTGAAAEFMGAEANPFRATVGLRIGPAPAGSGVRFRLGIERGALTPAFLKAVEETVRRTLGQGLHGWQVTDCTVTLTHSAYVPPPPHGWSKWSSAAGDFRGLTPLVLMTALRQAGTRVYEPVHRFRLEVPADTVAAVWAALGPLRAGPRASVTRGPVCVLEGDIPAARVHDLEQMLPGLTRGEGVLEAAFGRYEPVRGPVPERPRADHNPLNRKEFLMHLTRGVPGLGPGT